MVKVGSMRRAKRILLIASMLLLSAGAMNATLWKHSKGDQSAEAAVPALTSLNAIELESVPSSRLVLRTSATPAYTSYSPTPDTFVVDLAGTSKASTLAMPSPLPPSVSSVSAEEVTEMGHRLTRVTLHLLQPLTLEAAADGNAVAIALPAPPAPVAAMETPLPSVTPAAEPVAQTPVETAKVETPKSEPLPEPAKPVAEPNVTSEPISTAAAAKTLKNVTTSGRGASLEVQLKGDGEIAYNAFKLENPSRIVLDLQGVKDAMPKSAITVGDPYVKKIRVSQYKGAPDPVTRVVLDLDEKVDFKVTKAADRLVVSFDEHPIVVPQSAPAVAVAEVKPEPAKPEPPKAEMKKAETPEPVKVAEAKPVPVKSDVTERVPVIAESVPEWKMPEKKATAVINAPAEQQPPSTSKKKKKSTKASTTPAEGTSEDVFTEDQQQQPQPQPAIPNAAQTIGGGRTLSAAPTVYTGEPITLKLKDADVKDVLRTFAELTGLNVAVDPDVHGSATVDFNDVPWDQALDIILRQNGLGYSLEGNVMRVGTLGRLASEAAAARILEEEKRLSVALKTVSYKLSYARAGEVAGLLRELASPRARIIVDTRTNQLIITDIPAYIDVMRALIDAVDVATKQVVIEARIVETSKNFLQQYGFAWGFRGSLDPSLGTGTGLVFPNRVDFVGGPFSFGPGNPIITMHMANVLNTFSLDVALNAAEAEGLVRVVSAPRVQTQDNVPAEIQSGFQIPYQTRVNFTTTVTYLDATLRLSVTPQVTDSGTVIMDIAVQKNEPETGLAIEGAAGTPISTRQARTRLMVRDGGTTVIAGIYQTKENNSQTRLPFVWQIPIIGNLFKTHNISTTHDELLIFITPRIVRVS